MAIGDGLDAIGDLAGRAASGLGAVASRTAEGVGSLIPARNAALPPSSSGVVPAIEDAPPPELPEIVINRISPEILANVAAFNALTPYNNILSTAMRAFFNRPGENRIPPPFPYYGMVNTIYAHMSNDIKQEITRTYSERTEHRNISFKEDSVSPIAYRWSVFNLKVIDNNRGSNSYFEAISQGINIFNRNIDIFHAPTNNKIVYENYGNGDEQFTIQGLRDIIATEVLKTPATAIANSRAIATQINDAFEASLTNWLAEHGIMDGVIPIEDYNRLLSNAYFSNNRRGLVVKPVFATVPPIDNPLHMRPFTVVETNDLITAFITSEAYWIDNIGIYIIQKVLHLCSIVILKTNNRFRVVNADIANVRNPFSKYIFLCKENNAYNLITFTYIHRTSAATKRKKRISIFADNLAPHDYPPFYMIFLLFSTYYIRLPNADKQNVRIMLRYFQELEAGLNLIYNEARITDPVMDPPTQEYYYVRTFIRYFKDYFGNPDFPAVFMANYPNITDANVAAMVIPPSPVVRYPAFGGGEINLIQTGGQYYNHYGDPYNSNPYNSDPYNSDPYNSNHYGNHIPNNHSYMFNNNPGLLNVLDSTKDSKIGYHIKVDVELVSGTNLTPEQISKSKCSAKWNSIKKSFANFTGKKYVVKPVYNYNVTKKNDKTYNSYSDNRYNNGRYNTRYSNDGYTNNRYSNDEYSNDGYTNDGYTNNRYINNRYSNNRYTNNNRYTRRPYYGGNTKRKTIKLHT